MLCAAPWHSFYVVLATLLQSYNGEGSDSSGVSSKTSTCSLAEEEDLQIDVRDENDWLDSLPVDLPLETRESASFHFRRIVPWIVYIILGFFVYTGIRIYYYVHRLLVTIYNLPTSDDPTASLSARKRREFEIRQALHLYSRALQSTDAQYGTPRDGHEEVICWRVPPAGVSSESRDRRAISEGCAICIFDYKVGDVVSWSSNPKCRHVFHTDCIASFQVHSGSTRCPFCRRAFIVKETSTSDGDGDSLR